MNFKEKAQSLTAKKIIMVMVESLIPPPLIKINMGTFGSVQKIPIKFLGIKIGSKKVCFGCAATNTICKISGKLFTKDNIEGIYSRAEFLEIDTYFLNNFELAIDNLRCGNILNYNYRAEKIGIAQIINEKEIFLKTLSSDYVKEDLDCYIELANSQE